MIPAETKNPTVATSRYQNPAVADCGLVPVGFTLGYPRFTLGYKLAKNLRELAPDREMWDLDDTAFEAAYSSKLDRIGVDRIGEILGQLAREHGSKGVVLLCYEDLREPGTTCHRESFARFWEERTGVPVPELEDTSPRKAARAVTRPRRDLASQESRGKTRDRAVVVGTYERELAAGSAEARHVAALIQLWAVERGHHIEHTAKALKLVTANHDTLLLAYPGPDWDAVYFEVGRMREAGLVAQADAILASLQQLSPKPISTKQPGLSSQAVFEGWATLDNQILPSMVDAYRLVRARPTDVPHATPSSTLDRE